MIYAKMLFKNGMSQLTTSKFIFGLMMILLSAVVFVLLFTVMQMIRLPLFLFGASGTPFQESEEYGFDADGNYGLKDDNGNVHR